MRKIAASILPAFALLAASPAMALTKGQANCPLELAKPALSQSLVSSMVDREDGEEVDEDVLTGIYEIFQACSKREGVPEAQAKDYMTYVTEAIAVAELTRQLTAAGIKVATIDQAMDIGPGRANPSPDEMDDVAFERLRTLLAKDGIRIESLPERQISLIGSYAALAGDLWKVRARLN